MSATRMTDNERVALLTGYADNSYCPIYERDKVHGKHPRCQHCRFKETTDAR